MKKVQEKNKKVLQNEQDKWLGKVKCKVVEEQDCQEL